MSDASSSVLIVDDSAPMRRIIRGIFQGLGFSTQESRDGREALEWLREGGRVDLAVVDWNMPEMSGIELVQEIRADARFEAMRVMMVTTETEMSRVTSALEAGANEFVMKPFTREIIVDKLRILGLWD